MAGSIKGFYNRRYPERTDYYRIIEGSFEEFERSYPELFEEKYGYLRKEVLKAIYAFLDCGIPENGIARVRCEQCGYDFFVAYSCRCRVVCPSCSTKRSILFGEKVREMVKPLSHLHITFTIPKILRIYFRRNRRLLKLLVQSAHYAVEKYFGNSLRISDGFTAGIYCVQSQGSLFNYHPHIHGLVLAGVIKEGLFYEQTNISSRVIGEIFRARLLTVLQEQGMITRELVDMLLSWHHNSGFNVHAKGRINGSDGKGIENVARYMSRAAISVERVEFNPDDNTITVYERQDRLPAQSATYTIMEFMALLAGHIPVPYESMTYYYGLYSSSHRGKEKRENGDSQGIEVKEEKGHGRASSTWSRLIHRIFEVDPLKCRKCGGKMRIIAFITQRSETVRILKHIGEETKRDPPLRARLSPENPQEPWFGDFMPPVEVYIGDPEYTN